MLFSSYLLKEWLRICVCFRLILLCYLAAGVWGIAQSGAQGLCGGLDHCHQSASGDPHLPPAGCAALEGIVLAYKNQNDWLRAYSLVTLISPFTSWPGYPVHSQCLIVWTICRGHWRMWTIRSYIHCHTAGSSRSSLFKIHWGNCSISAKEAYLICAKSYFFALRCFHDIIIMTLS